MTETKTRQMKPSGVPWLGDIPAGWDVKRGKEILAPLKRPIREDDEIVTCFRDGEVTLRRNRREDGFTVAEKEIGYQGVEKGDLIVHGMDGFAGSIGVSDSRGKASPVLIVLNSTENKRFLMYYLRSLALCDVFLSLSTGIRERSCDLRWNKIGNIPYLLPPLPEQRAIADFLDEKCAAIDAIVEEAKSGIEEYAKWKQSVVFQAVTKGLDPHAKMKDSGVEWIGEIPEKWEVLPLKALCSMDSGKTLSAEQIAVEGMFPVYGANGQRGFFSEWNTEGPILLVGRQGALCGNVHRVNGRFWATEHALRTIPKKQVFLDYLFHLLTGMNLNRYVSQTAAQPGLAASVILNVRTILPPLPEQRAIAAYLDEKCSAIDALIEEKKQLIEDLGVYKKSLIYETVTGKRRIEQ